MCRYTRTPHARVHMHTRHTCVCMHVHGCGYACVRGTHTHNCEFSSDGPEDQEGSRLRGPTCRKLGRRAPRSLELRVAAFPAASSAAASGGRPVPGPLARMLSHFSSLIGTLSPCGNPKQILRGRIACPRPAVGSDSARPAPPLVVLPPLPGLAGPCPPSAAAEPLFTVTAAAGGGLAAPPGPSPSGPWRERSPVGWGHSLSSSPDWSLWGSRSL